LKSSASVLVPVFERFIRTILGCIL
jgi:hypothetical protein